MSPIARDFVAYLLEQLSLDLSEAIDAYGWEDGLSQAEGEDLYYEITDGTGAEPEGEDY